jgi:tight adherence protein B
VSPHAAVAHLRHTVGARLERAGAGIGPDAFVACIVGAGAISALLLFVALRRPIVLLVGPVVALVVWRVALGLIDRAHMRRVADAMPGVALMLGSAVAAGLSLRQAIVRTARDTPDPLGVHLRAVSAELELGARVDDALGRLHERLPDPDLGLLVTAILVQRRTGGYLARALRDMSSRLEERRRLAREVRGATAQARATAWMVAALPLLGAALAESASPGLIARSLGHGVGLVILVVSVSLQVAGVVMIRRIAAVDA